MDVHHCVAALRRSPLPQAALPHLRSLNVCVRCCYRFFGVRADGVYGAGDAVLQQALGLVQEGDGAGAERLASCQAAVPSIAPPEKGALESK